MFLHQDKDPDSFQLFEIHIQSLKLLLTRGVPRLFRFASKNQSKRPPKLSTLTFSRQDNASLAISTLWLSSKKGFCLRCLPLQLLPHQIFLKLVAQGLRVPVSWGQMSPIKLFFYTFMISTQIPTSYKKPDLPEKTVLNTLSSQSCLRFDSTYTKDPDRTNLLIPCQILA